MPLVEAEDALKVNWCEVTVTLKGKQVYHNSFVTDFAITSAYVVGLVAGGCARWEIENNNVLMDFMMKGLEIGPYEESTAKRN